jgi:fructose-1,6-bisphosphatase/inositol monophosphatase family enzyme
MTDPRAALPAADIARFRNHALAMADEARTVLRRFFAEGASVRTKADTSYVTEADLTLERRLREMTAAAFPDHGAIGEEFGRHLPDADFQWVFDPVDGTEEFVRRLPTFGSIIGLFFRGEPVAGVIELPALEWRAEAAFGMGCFYNGARMRITDLEPGTAIDKIRLTMSARTNFTHYRQDGHLFDAVTRAFPNQCIYRSCYAHLCAVMGASDAALDVANPIWDTAAARILTEEAGGAYRVLQDFTVDGERIYSSAFGRPAVVARLAAIFERG